MTVRGAGIFGGVPPQGAGMTTEAFSAAMERAMRDRGAEPVWTTSTPCPECGCSPGDPWYCGCSNPDCPCSEREDDEDDQ